MAATVTEFPREPAFQLGRFKKGLHADFNDEFCDDLLAVLNREKQAGDLAVFQAKLDNARKCRPDAIGPAQAVQSFQVCRFYRNLTADFTEAFSDELLAYLESQEKLTKYVYAFRQKLDNRLNDGWVPGTPYQERKAV